MQFDNTRKPADWEREYTITITGKTVEALRFLVSHMLKCPHSSLSTIAAADHLFHIQQRIRAGQTRPEEDVC